MTQAPIQIPNSRAGTTWRKARPVPATRRYSPYQSCQVFIRDGFIDRYAGTRLVFPGALRILSIEMPKEFPFHPNWKMSESHIVYWELFPTIDHVVPVSKGGADEEQNWVSTSMLRNNAKSNWTLEELGWELKPQGDVRGQCLGHRVVLVSG